MLKAGGYGDVVKNYRVVAASDDACVFLISGLLWTGALFLFIRHINSLTRKKSIHRNKFNSPPNSRTLL